MWPDWQLLWNVPWNRFTVQCQGCGESHKSDLIVAASKPYLTVRNSGGDWLLTCFPKPACPIHLFSLKPIHGNRECWKDLDCLAKIFNAQQIFMTLSIERKQYIGFPAFSANQAEQNKWRKKIGCIFGVWSTWKKGCPYFTFPEFSVGTT